MNRIAIWDLPTRLFHWAIVLLIPALWATHALDRMDLHILLGETMLGLVLFRILWGFLGSSTARFSGFIRGPRAIAAYLRGTGDGDVGHNPLGALSVLALLLILAVQIGLGLFASDEDGLNYGPLSHLVSYDTARTLADRHETFFNILLVFIGLHLAAIAFYLVVRRKNLVGPMVTGGRGGADGERAMVAAPLWRFLLAAFFAVAATWTVSNFL